MSLRRVVSLLGVSLVASAGLVAAAPDAKKKAPTPVAPAKDEPAKGAGAGSAAAAPTDAAGSGAAPAPADEPPPKDMNGTDENPDAPHGLTNEPVVEATAPVVKKSTGYPI